jgi:hypothetical protein
VKPLWEQIGKPKHEGYGEIEKLQETVSAETMEEHGWYMLSEA